jgi:3-hydroxypropanoate dehydrogenase
MSQRLDDRALQVLFTEARTYSRWLAREVPDDLLRDLVTLATFPPTSANCQPMRLVFVKSPAAKAALKPHLAAGNVDKTMAAPVTAIVAHDLTFYERLPRLFPATDAKSWFVGKPAHIEATAFRNGSLQGAYLILAARALGLDCGPMSGFDADGVDAAFLAGTPHKSNFLINLGYGDRRALHPRAPRPAFDETARIV